MRIEENIIKEDCFASQRKIYNNVGMVFRYKNINIQRMRINRILLGSAISYILKQSFENDELRIQEDYRT